MPITFILHKAPKRQNGLAVTLGHAFCVGACGFDQVNVTVSGSMRNQPQQLAENDLITLAALAAGLHQRRAHLGDSRLEMVQLGSGNVTLGLSRRAPRHYISLNRAVPVDDTALLVAFRHGKEIRQIRRFAGEGRNQLQRGLVDRLPGFAYSDEFIAFASTKKRTVHTKHSLAIQSVG